MEGDKIIRYYFFGAEKINFKNGIEYLMTLFNKMEEEDMAQVLSIHLIIIITSLFFFIV